MQLLTKWKIKRVLRYTDYRYAADVIKEEFEGGVIKKELAQLFDAYLENPCFNTAIDIIRFDPKALYLFAECKPGGIYDVRRKVEAANQRGKSTQPHMNAPDI